MDLKISFVNRSNLVEVEIYLIFDLEIRYYHVSGLHETDGSRYGCEQQIHHQKYPSHTRRQIGQQACEYECQSERDTSRGQYDGSCQLDVVNCTIRISNVDGWFNLFQ